MKVIREMLSDIGSKTFDFGFVGEKNHTCVMINCVIVQTIPGRSGDNGSKTASWRYLPRYFAQGRYLCGLERIRE